MYICLPIIYTSTFMKTPVLKKTFCFVCLFVLSIFVVQGAERFVYFTSQPSSFLLFAGQSASSFRVAVDVQEFPGVVRAAEAFASDWKAVTGNECSIVRQSDVVPDIVIGTWGKSRQLSQWQDEGLLDLKDLAGKTEQYIVTTVHSQSSSDSKPVVVIAGSDKRGTIYGIFECSRQLGVSPWYWWADVPTEQQDSIFFVPGTYTDGEPTVRYRGIFLNDEAPCLTGWVAETFPDSLCPTARPTARGYNHHFYECVFELLQRLKANFLWPAMWNNAFYADDPMNMVLADEMGIIMGTSHHEPMARNHQEWARRRNEFGAWDYETNRDVVRQFFTEGVRRVRDNEDLITIGMRGDGDAPMGGKEGEDDKYVSRDEYNKNLLERIIADQRSIIASELKTEPDRRQQVLAVYKEVQRLFELGMEVPEDVLILLCDDNWGNIRRVPAPEARQRKGGWGMYYHVDYVGAPRSTKWTNVTPVSHLWEQMQLAYQYGVDRLWILNVGDLKPMEYPIQLFLDMAWRPQEFTVHTFQQHMLHFCEACFGKEQAAEAARIMQTYLQYNGRVTPEMLNAKTYNLETGEFKDVMLSYKQLEAEALRQYLLLQPQYRDAYYELILFPVQAMSNLYEMYYAVAKNHHAYAQGLPEANEWADKVDACFERDAWLTRQYHNELAGGKWNHMMDEPHIGYTSWNGPGRNIRPEVYRIAEPSEGGYSYMHSDGYVSIEAPRYYAAYSVPGTKWEIIPNMGRTLGGVALMPYTQTAAGAELTYRLALPEDVDSVRVHIITNSTLAFLRHEGHRYGLSMDNGPEVTINYNGQYNEDNQWQMYDVVATRVIETTTTLPVLKGQTWHTLHIRPLDPGMVLEKIVVDYGGYRPSYLFGTESPVSRLEVSQSNHQ